MNFLSKASFYLSCIAFIALAIPWTHLTAQTAVSVGSGSYASAVPAADLETDSYYGLPADQIDQFYSLLHMYPSLQGQPIPTNHWWTDMLIANRSIAADAARLNTPSSRTLRRADVGHPKHAPAEKLRRWMFITPIRGRRPTPTARPRAISIPAPRCPLHGDIPYHIPAAMC